MDFGMPPAEQDAHRSYNSRDIGFHDILNQARQSVGNQRTKGTENLNARCRLDVASMVYAIDQSRVT